MELPSFTFGNLRPEAEDLTVFMCGKCRLPLGDSSDWDGRVCGDGVFHLKAVSDNVCFENEPVISSYPNETGWYTFGSARKQVLSPCDAPLTLEKCHIFEDEIKKCKQVLGVLQRKVEALESELHHSPYEEEDNS